MPLFRSSTVLYNGVRFHKNALLWYLTDKEDLAAASNSDEESTSEEDSAEESSEGEESPSEGEANEQGEESSEDEQKGPYIHPRGKKKGGTAHYTTLMISRGRDEILPILCSPPLYNSLTPYLASHLA